MPELKLLPCACCGDAPDHTSTPTIETAHCPLCDITMHAITWGVLCAKWNSIMGPRK